MGVMYYELLTAEYPFAGKTLEETYKNIKEQDLVASEHLQKELLFDETWEIVCLLLARDPDHRITLLELLELLDSLLIKMTLFSSNENYEPNPAFEPSLTPNEIELEKMDL